jgi:hypothetical protein
VRFFTHSKKTTDVMIDLFQKTFGFELVAESPYTLGKRIGFTDAQLEAWEELEPTLLSAAPPLEAGARPPPPHRSSSLRSSSLAPRGGSQASPAGRLRGRSGVSAKGAR